MAKTHDLGNASRFRTDIALLQTFHLVARLGSFSAAAKKLNVSYQTAANQVRRLEQIYRVRLVIPQKGSRQIVLTPQGHALHASLGDELDTILTRISVLLRDVRSVLRVGVPQALFHHFFPQILERFGRRAGDIQLEFYERDATLERMMIEGELDAVVSERSFSTPLVAQQLIASYRLALAYPRAWVGESAGQPGLGFFRDRDFLTYEDAQIIRVRSMDFLKAVYGEPPRIAISASGSTSITAMVDQGLGYSIVPEWCVKGDDPRIGKLILENVEPMKIWFAHVAFLSENRFIRLLREVSQETFSGEGGMKGQGSDLLRSSPA